MSGGRRPGMGPALGPPYQPHTGPQHPYMGQHGMPPMAPGQQQQRFMMGGGQMGGQMYGPGPTPQPGGMYGMPPSSQQGPVGHPGPPVSPAARPATPQHAQQHSMQALMQNSPKQPSPAPSASSEHGSTHSNKPGEDGPEIKTEPSNPEDPGGDNSRHPRPVPSPVGSTGSRSNTPASIPGGTAGSPMPVRPNSGQLDGQNRMTQSPMATQGYSQQMMPPPNSMGYMPPSSGKMGGGPMPGHYPQYNSQYPQGNYGRQQPGMPGMGGPPMSGPMQSYSQPGMYPPGQMSGQMSGPMQGQMGGPPMYGGNMSMNRGGQGGYYPPQPGMMGGGGGQYPPYPHMGPMPPNMAAGMQQPQGMVPQQMAGPGMPPSSAPTSAPSSNKAAQAAQAAMMAAANTLGPRSMASSRGAMSPSRGMFSQSGGGPLAQMNSMTNSPNLGSPSLNSMSNAVEQLTRSIPSHSSSPSPVPKSAALAGNSSEQHANHLPSPVSNSSDFQENSSRPNSTSTGPVGPGPELPANESTTGSDSSGGVPSDSTSVDSGFHSSDQGEKNSDGSNAPGQSGLSPPPSQQPNGDHHPHHHHQQHQQQQQQHHPHHPYPHHPHHQQQQHLMQNQQQHMYPPRTSDNMSPLGQHPASQQYPRHPHMGGPDPKMPYNNAGVPLPPSSLSSAMSSMPSSTGALTTASAGPMSTSVTQSIASPVTSVSTMASPHPSQPQTHHMGPQAPHGPHGPHGMMSSHSMGPPPHAGMMPNGGMPPNSMMPPGHMGGHMGHGMMPPHSMNGPMMGHAGQMMGHNGPMMPGNMPPMGQMPPQQQPPPPQSPMQVNSNNGSSVNSMPSDDPPEKKKKNKKSSDVSKLFDMGPEPDRRPFIERVLAFLEESGQGVTTMPVISKTPIDLYKLYFCVREKGGFEEVTRNKKWRDICQVVNIGTSASAAFTLKKNYIRYLFNYECKYDRGGINPAPILAQMEAQLAHKREQKSKRAPSPAGSTNSNDAFRPPSVPNNQSDPGFPPNLPPPYMQQGPDGTNMPPNPHMSGGSMMMGPGMMPGPSPHGNMGNMMGGPPGPGMMQQQGMMGAGPPPHSSGSMMGGPPMGPGYNGGHMMPQQAGPMASNSVSVQDPFSDESYHARMASPATSGSGQPTPPPPPQSAEGGAPASLYPSMQMSNSMMGSTNTSSSNNGRDQQMGFQGSGPPTSDAPSSGPQFPFGQQFDRPDRYDQSSPSLGARPPGPQDNGSIYSGAPRFPAPQYQSQGPSYPPGSQYSGYSQGPPGGHYGGPRPSGPMYGTPSKRYPEDHSERGQWSPMQRSRHSGSGQGYLPPSSPSTPPMGPYSRQLAAPRASSAHGRERYSSHKMPPAYGGQLAANLGKKDLSFPPDCVESVSIASTKRKRLTHKDLAPFEAWRLMLSLKSGLLAESTWALDTLNILLYDDTTYGYFSLATLPGLLEVLAEHFRHCLLAMFDGFDELEAGLASRRQYRKSQRSIGAGVEDFGPPALDSPRSENELSVQLLSGFNYTMVSRKGLPVKLDTSPSDSTVLDGKKWDIPEFHTPSDHWSQGCGDITDHILTHFESSTSNSFLATKFKRKRAGEEDTTSQCKRNKPGHGDKVSAKRADCAGDNGSVGTLRLNRVKEEQNGCNQERKASSSPRVYGESYDKCKDSGNSNTAAEDSKTNVSNSMCNGGSGAVVKMSSETCNVVQIKQEPAEELPGLDSDAKVQPCNGKENTDFVQREVSTPAKPLENGDIEQPKLSPMVNHKGSPQPGGCKDADDVSDSSPPVLKAEGLEDFEAMEVGAEPLNSTMKAGSSGESMQADTSIVAGDGDASSSLLKPDDETVTEEAEKTLTEENKNSGDSDRENNASSTSVLSDNHNPPGHETEELSASFVSDMLREDGTVEEEAYQRDDPPLCVTPEDRDELGRRCVCISNIVRSLSCVPGNEAAISKHAGMMRILGKLLLLHHSHPPKPSPRRLPQGDQEEEDREEESPPRVYDDEHWWWDYLDQLRENTLVTLANICGHLQLASFSEAICFPLLEGLLHWLTCPASVARDPLPTLGTTSVLSPERLVLEALCKLCIHETNVDLLLATAHIRNLLSLYSTLVRLLADRQHQIPREFAIVLLSLLVPADGSVARAVALQPPSVALFVDFLETAEQAALSIASQQGVEALQANPEAMGTSLDMLRRAASILLHMARVPDNRKMFLPQQSRLLNLVMSQILDQSVSNTLAEVLFECSQFS